jgi:ABC-type polysaccharide/polyol phosphate transport system ATPase subunit
VNAPDTATTNVAASDLSANDLSVNETGASFALPDRQIADDPAVIVDHVAKRFRIYHERNASLKASVMRGKRAEYEEFWAVNDVSFTVNKGETFGIVGENGSGKSTLLKCMARILRPEKGSVAIAGKLSALLELGAGFHQELSGRDNVYLNGSILGLTKREIDKRFDGIVEFAGLERFIDTPVKNYSSGMYVRLGFSVAINVDPDVLLVDEVLSVGDETFQRRCAEKFTEMQREGKTIVVVSHGLGQLRAMCDRLAWMRNGQLAGVGPTKDVIDEYLGTVNVSRLPGHDGESKRWGSGEAAITAIELIDPQGKTVDKVHTGDDIKLRIRYRVQPGMTIKRPGVGFGIHRLDGVLVTGVNTHEQKLFPEQLTGVGYYDYTIKNLPLLTGTYDVSAAIQDEKFTTTYDWWFEGFRFDVLPRLIHETEGVLTTFGVWSQEAE